MSSFAMVCLGMCSATIKGGMTYCTGFGQLVLQVADTNEVLKRKSAHW